MFKMVTLKISQLLQTKEVVEVNRGVLQGQWGMDIATEYQVGWTLALHYVWAARGAGALSEASSILPLSIS